MLRMRRSMIEWTGGLGHLPVIAQSAGCFAQAPLGSNLFAKREACGMMKQDHCGAFKWQKAPIHRLNTRLLFNGSPTMIWPRFEPAIAAAPQRL